MASSPAIEDGPSSDASASVLQRSNTTFQIIRHKGPVISAGRLPHHILLYFFQYLRVKDLYACMTVCRHWASFLDYEDNEVWELLCRRIVPEHALSDPYLLSKTFTYKAKIRAFFNAWNPTDGSRNVYVRPNGFTMHRNPIAQSTDGIRGKVGHKSGCHAWEISWEGPLGTVAVVGLATRHAALQCPGYLPLLGSDDQSWGWNLVDNTLLHNGQMRQPFPSRPKATVKYQVGDKVRMVLDCDVGKLYFEHHSEFLGVAFQDLPPLKLFPAVCAVYGNTEVTMVYTGPPQMG